MSNNLVYLNRDLVEPSTHSIYQPNDKHFKELVNSLKEIGLEKPISVCPIPDSKKHEIIDGDLRYFGWCRALDHKEILCEIKNVEYKSMYLIEKRIELNRHRQKTLADKLQEGLEYYNSFPEEQGERNDLKGEKKGSRMDRASKKCGASMSYLYAYKKIVEHDKKYPDAGLLKMFRQNQI